MIIVHISTIVQKLAKIKNISFSDARANLAELVAKAKYQGDRYLISKHGKQVAGLISLQDLQLLEALEDKIALQGIAQIRKEDTVTLKGAKAILGL